MKITHLFVSIFFCMFFLAELQAAPFDRFLMPGKVVDSHKKFETTCDKCHEAFDKTKQNKLCLDCHEKINEDVSDSRGFHGKEKSVKQDECRVCHTDHIGRKANIVNLDKFGFNHKYTDYLLKGEHQKISCDSCHFKDKKYRDAPAICFDCHKKDDVHQNRMGKKCHDCHSESGWKKAKFDHDKTKYKLKGKHKKVICADCHPNQRFKATPIVCVSCHKVQDVHRGEFGDKCQKCHNEEKWNNILFDHDKQTKFKLEFQHAKISCGSCHTKNAYKFKLKKDCFSCHQADDKHNAQFNNKCEKCHQEKSWKKITFNHDKDTKFPLLDAHKVVICKACHIGNVYKDKLKTDCGSCHGNDDIHNAKLGNNCIRCHDQKKWAENIAFDHDLTKFPLIGLHGITSCESCHNTTEYKTNNTRCYFCHKSEDVHELKLTGNCETCHTPNGWKVWLFSHNDQTEYKLDGEHALVECVACHKEPIKNLEHVQKKVDNSKGEKALLIGLTALSGKTALGRKTALSGKTALGGLIILSDKCESCHTDDDIHSGKFGKRCEKCHSTDSFKNITKLN